MTLSVGAVIAIDGVSGSGKTTVSSKLAQHLGWHILPSGMLYRFLAYQRLQDKTDLQALQQAQQLEFIMDGCECKVMSQQADITAALLQDEVGELASREIAVDPKII